MPLLTDHAWTAEAATELQEDLNRLERPEDRTALLVEVYECSKSWADRHCDTLRHVHPEHLVSVLQVAEVARPSHEVALNWISCLTYSDETGDTATGIRTAQGVYA